MTVIQKITTFFCMTAMLLMLDSLSMQLYVHAEKPLNIYVQNKQMKLTPPLQVLIKNKKVISVVVPSKHVKTFDPHAKTAFDLMKKTNEWHVTYQSKSNRLDLIRIAAESPTSSHAILKSPTPQPDQKNASVTPAPAPTPAILVYYHAYESAKGFAKLNHGAWNPVPFSLVPSDVAGFFVVGLAADHAEVVFVNDAEELDNRNDQNYVFTPGVWQVRNGKLHAGKPFPLPLQTQFDARNAITLYYASPNGSAGVYYTVNGLTWTKDPVPMKSARFKGYAEVTIPSNGWIRTSFVDHQNLQDTNNDRFYEFKTGSWTIEDGKIQKGTPGKEG